MAIGDTATALAIPVESLKRDGSTHDFLRILERAREHGAETLIIGMPWSLDGRFGPQARIVSAFVQQLKTRSEFPVEIWDERLTSVEANQRLRDHRNKGRGRGRRLALGTEDSVAASIMLQAYLDAHSDDGPL